VMMVGYGDLYPVTVEGRVVAVVLMVTGVGTFATLAGALASWFLADAGGREERR
jgi:voltage-gated potassium channel